MSAPVKEKRVPRRRNKRAPRYTPFFFTAVAIHAFVLLQLGRALHEQPAYGLSSGGASMEVGLVAAASDESVTAPEERVEEPPPPPEPSEFAIPKPEKKKQPKPKKKVVKTQPKPAVTPVAHSTAAHSGAATGEGGKIGTGRGVERGIPDYLSNPPPAYPLLSRRLKEEGLVLLSVTISPEGNAEEVTLRRSSGFERLDEAALKAVRRWRFKPSRLGGIAISDTVQVPVRFQLN